MLLRFSPVLLTLLGVLAGCGGNDSPASRCGAGQLTEGAWVDVGVGAGIGVGYGVGWYNPGDTYDPALDNSNSDTGGSSDGSTDDGSTDDPSGGWDTGDTGGDSNTESVTRLKLASASASQTPSADGCWTCAVGCTTGSGAETTGKQALGASATSHDDACSAAVRSLEHWAHRSYRQRIQSCRTLDANPETRAPATPTLQGPANQRPSSATSRSRSRASSSMPP